MAPLGKFTLSVIGLRLFGAAGFFWGMFLGHLLIDRSLVGKWIENRLSELDDNVRLLLPYGFYKYYSRLDDNLFGKVWGALLGAAAFGWGGFITLFILGHPDYFSYRRECRLGRITRPADFPVQLSTITL